MGKGTPEGLAEECKKAGIGYDCIPDVKIDGIVVSSTYIRQLISLGDMERVTKFLGHPYTITGVVAHGRKVGRTYGVPTVKSSTYIRQLISLGDMERVTKFLGHPYTITGVVAHGRKVGRTYGVPTVNLPLPPEMALPPYGVYATRVCVDDQVYLAATNIGVKPTFVDGGAPTIEPHLLDFSGDLYGKLIHVELHQFLRPTHSC